MGGLPAAGGEEVWRKGGGEVGVVEEAFNKVCNTDL